MRRQLLPALLAMIVFTVLTGIAYPLVVTGIAQVGIRDKANGSLVTRGGHVVGSHLIGQSFTDAEGNPLPQYFQSRPSAASGAAGKTTAGDDPTLSSGSNYGPTNPLLVGFIPGLNVVDRRGNPSTVNPFATSDDPSCVPMDRQGHPVTKPSSGQRYARSPDGSFVCDPNTVPERVLAYRQLNGLPSDAQVPVDAVTTSGSGLDPDISLANARLQAPRVARARHLPSVLVERLVAEHRSSRTVGVLGETTVNVLSLNLALDRLRR
jgi:potassium-transporting ATPase KdpC subunit